MSTPRFGFNLLVNKTPPQQSTSNYTDAAQSAMIAALMAANHKQEKRIISLNDSLNSLEEKHELEIATIKNDLINMATTNNDTTVKSVAFLYAHFFKDTAETILAKSENS
jgi:hypothetical protein